MIGGKLLAMAAFLAAATGAQPAGAASSDLNFTAHEEEALLLANKVTAAAERCDFQVDHGNLEKMLSAAGISARDMETKRQSGALKQDVTTYVKSFRNNKQQVCAAALADYGPSRAAGPLLSR